LVEGTSMWVSFWITVGFGVLFVLVERWLDQPLPWGVGVIPASVASIATNGWEAFWHFKIHMFELCTDSGRCYQTDLPDPSRPPDPPGWFLVLQPWDGDHGVWGWLLISVPFDLAGSGVAAAIIWILTRPAR
jgi:hypothetical protein